MNWKNEAISDLEKYSQRKKSIENMELRISNLEEEFVSLKGIGFDEKVKSNKNSYDEKWLNNITERERLAVSLKIAKTLVGLTEKGLNDLDDAERKVLIGFYIDDRDNRVMHLCHELCMEKSSLYRLKEKALNKFVRSEYGIIEL